MAGRNQHHIPQSVLRGFARNANEEPKRVWHYLRGAPVAHKATSEVAAQRDFYSKPDGTGATLDDIITNYENEQFSALLVRLRDLTPGDSVPHDDATEYLGHLIPRGDHMRRVFGETMSRALDNAKALVRDPDAIATFLKLDDFEPGGPALEEIRRLIDSPQVDGFLSVAKIPRSVLERLGFAMLREFGTPLLAKTAIEYSGELDGLSVDIKGSIRKAHTDALQNVPIGHRMPHLERFEFTIEESCGDLVLPDCVAIGIDQSGAMFPLTMIKRDEASVIVAPLSTNRMLVGRTAVRVAFPNSEKLQAGLAASSHMFFVAASDNFRELHSELGVVSEAELSRLMREIFEKQTDLLPDNAAKPPISKKFSIATPPSLSKKNLQQFSQVIEEIASNVNSQMPLDTFQGLNVTESGDLSACGLYLVDHGALYGDVHEGELRLWCHIPRAVAETLSGDSPEDELCLSFQFVLAMFLRLAAASRLDGLSPEYFREPAADAHVAIHFRGIAGAIPAYFGINILNVEALGSRMFGWMDGAAIEALRAADERMEAAKQAFLRDNDADVFARIAGECVMMVSSASAAIAGCCEGELESFPLFKQALLNRGLASWFKCYSRDLKKFWQEPRSVLEPRSWSIHSERIMFQWAVVSWPEEQGRFMIWVLPSQVQELVREGVKAVTIHLEEGMSHPRP